MRSSSIQLTNQFKKTPLSLPKTQVDSQQELPAGSEEECEIRAATIVAMERLRTEVLALARAKRRDQRRERRAAEKATAASAAAASAAAASAAAPAGKGDKVEGEVKEGAEVEKGAEAAATGDEAAAEAEEESKADELEKEEAAAEQQEEEDAEEADSGDEEDEELLSIHLDWWLWGVGEKARSEHPPHHRTLTIYY